MNENGNQSNLSEIGEPVLSQAQKQIQETVMLPKLTEEKLLRAKNVVLSLLISANKNQILDCEELHRVEVDLQMKLSDLTQIHESIACICTKINDICTAIREKQEKIQTFGQLMQELEASIPNISVENIDKIIDHYETDQRNNINNSISKILDYNKYE